MKLKSYHIFVVMAVILILLSFFISVKINSSLEKITPKAKAARPSGKIPSTPMRMRNAVSPMRKSAITVIGHRAAGGPGVSLLKPQGIPSLKPSGPVYSPSPSAGVSTSGTGVTPKAGVSVNASQPEQQTEGTPSPQRRQDTLLF